MRLPFRVLLALAAAVLATPAAAQSPAPVGGSVVDSTGGAIVGAVVGLRLSDALERRVTTDTSGRFRFDSVPAGTGTLLVTADRFAPMVVDFDRSRSDVRVVLEPSPITERVTVIGTGLGANRLTTATKTDTLLRDVPQAVTVVSRRVIADHSMQNMTDVVRYVPGIGMAQGEGNRDAPVFRGNSSTSDFFVDGIRDDVQFFRDLYNVERVEALKGPNAMMFGRGGVGGVINRVTREANWATAGEVSAQIGSWNNRRFSADIGEGLTDRVAMRVTGVYENSDGYRSGTLLERQGINPTIAFSLGMTSTLRLGFEHFEDERTADRGVSSVNGRPLETDASTFFGDPASSSSEASINTFTALYETGFRNGVTLRNRVRYADYDKFYQNVFPGTVNAAAATVSISAYNNATERRNLFNQTDVILPLRTGRIQHTLVTGAELGRQETDNLRNTGFFTDISPTATAINVPLASPTVRAALTFRPGATDADNHGAATIGAVYAQDQIDLSRHLQAVLGIRYDRFDVDFTNNRTATDFSSTDDLVSPRVGLVFKPVAPVSVYGSYTLAYQPRSGEQLSSLSLTNQNLDPERFTNYEVGAKWDLRPDLSLTTAVYRLNRGNVVVPDPVNPAVSVLVDGQRSTGFELGLAGAITSAWTVMGAYAFQDGELTATASATAVEGARLAQLPENTFSLWNKVDVTRRVGAGLGIIHRGDLFSSTDNTVVVPAFTRVDGALYLTLHRNLRAQLNVENLFDEFYYASAHSNTNIMPGSPRAVRLTLTTGF